MQAVEAQGRQGIGPSGQEQAGAAAAPVETGFGEGFDIQLQRLHKPPGPQLHQPHDGVQALL